MNVGLNDADDHDFIPGAEVDDILLLDSGVVPSTSCKDDYVFIRIVHKMLLEVLSAV